MWKYFACLRGNHVYHVRVQPGRVFVECGCCGRRSHGWNLAAQSTTRAKQTLRLLLDESAAAATRAVVASRPRESPLRSARLASSTEFRLHLELSADGWTRLDGRETGNPRLPPKVGRKLRRVFQLVDFDRTH
jgi:hypothetical protein